MKKKALIIVASILLVIGAVTAGIMLAIGSRNKNEVEYLKELPKPQITGGARGELGIDKNINEETIDEYLNRPDSVYRDMRMLEDPGNYEAIGGDRFLSGYIEGFEVIPLPYIIPVTGLPGEVGDTYTGTTLFYDDNGTYIANYEESMEIIERIFPKDKVIFLMCGGGGYAGMTKNFLVSLGWDENKIYNVGGYWYYKGEHSISVKKEVNGEVTYDFNSVPYHEINFDKLTKSEKYKDPVIKVKELKISTSELELEEGTSFQLNVIVLPNEATNKEVKWTSSNESVATVSDEGLVKAVKEGKVTITVKSVEGDKTATCDATVNKKVISTHVELDDLADVIEEFSSYNLTKINKEFFDKTEYKRDSDGKIIPNEYYDLTENGVRANDLYREESRKWTAQRDEANAKRVEIFNKLVDEKKSFIVVIKDTDCESTFDVANTTQNVLKQNGFQYFIVSTAAGGGDGDEAFFGSKLDRSNHGGGAIAIIKDGKIYASSNPSVDALKSEEDIINWLSKYIDIK